MKIAVFASCLLFCGCTTQKMNDGLENFMSRRIQWAVDTLGYPDGQRQFMGDTIYIWTTNRQALLPFTNTTTTTGMVGNTPVYGSTYSTQMMPVNATCTIQLAVGPDGYIKHYQWEGNAMGCSRYSRRFGH